MDECRKAYEKAVPKEVRTSSNWSIWEVAWNQALNQTSNQIANLYLF